MVVSRRLMDAQSGGHRWTAERLWTCLQVHPGCRCSALCTGLNLAVHFGALYTKALCACQREKAAPLLSADGGLDLIQTMIADDGTQKLVFKVKVSHLRFETFLLYAYTQTTSTAWQCTHCSVLDVAAAEIAGQYWQHRDSGDCHHSCHTRVSQQAYCMCLLTGMLSTQPLPAQLTSCVAQVSSTAVAIVSSCPCCCLYTCSLTLPMGMDKQTYARAVAQHEYSALATVEG